MSRYSIELDGQKNPLAQKRYPHPTQSNPQYA